MKPFVYAVSVVSIVSVLWTGCGKKEESTVPPQPPAVEQPAVKSTPPPAPPETPKVPTKPVMDVLASAKDSVAKALALSKEGKYTEALAMLQAVAVEVQSNPEAKKLVDDAIAQVKKAMADAAAQSAADKVGGMLK
jgi:hypothetical protein